MTPQTNDTAPAGDGWVHGFVGGAEPLPWIAVTRCDGGWRCDDGHYRHPSLWLPLPDPQPKATGWSPPVGEIVVEAGWLGEQRQPVWLVSVVKPDASYDHARDPDIRCTLDQAVTAAIQWSAKIGLPWREGNVVHAQANVVPIEHGRRQ